MEPKRPCSGRNAPTSALVERVRALDRGADRVVGRPFAYEELLARLQPSKAKLVRGARGPRRRGELVVDHRSAAGVRPRRGGELSAKEFELLTWLATEPDRVFPGGLGIPRARADADARVSRVGAAPEAQPSSRRPLRRERVGCRLPAARVAGRTPQGNAPSSSKTASPSGRGLRRSRRGRRWRRQPGGREGRCGMRLRFITVPRRSAARG